MERNLAGSGNNRGFLAGGAEMVFRNIRYIAWFFVLNLLLGLFGSVAFSTQASTILDHSAHSERLVQGFDLAVLLEMVFRPEFGPIHASGKSAMYFALLFFVATALLLPGVFMGYASTYRLSRDEFFRVCGRNLWRFVRLLIVAGLVMIVVGGLLFAAQGGLLKKAGDSTNEMLPFEVKIATLAVIFLVMTAFRIAFDLAEADVVLNDQNAVRKSIASGFRHMWRSLGRLVVIYVAITGVAAIMLVAELWAWVNLVPAGNLLGAILVSQLTLLLLLVPRFWQRGVAVLYWQQRMLVPVLAVEPIMPEPVPAAVVPAPLPVIPDSPPMPESLT